MSNIWVGLIAGCGVIVFLIIFRDWMNWRDLQRRLKKERETKRARGEAEGCCAGGVESE